MTDLRRTILSSPRLSRASRRLYGLPGYGRLVRAVACALLARRGRVLPARAGYSVWLDRDTYEYVVGYLRDDYEPFLSCLLGRLLGEGDRFVDVGANIGHYALLAGAAVGPSGAVWAIEPDPGPFHALEGNVAASGLTNVTCVNTAVGDEAGHVRLFRSRRGGGMNSIYDSPLTEGQSPLTVPCVTLDAVLAGRRVSGLKIDVEGAEQKVLAGAEGLLEANPDLWLIVEWRPWFLERWVKVDGSALVRELWQRGLATLVVDEERRALLELTDIAHGLDRSSNYNLLCTRDPARLLARLGEAGAGGPTPPC